MAISSDAWRTHDKILLRMRLPLLTIVILFTVGILLDLYIFISIRRGRSVRRCRQWSTVYGISALISLSLLLYVAVIPKRDIDTRILTAMWLLYTYLTVYAAKAVYVLFSAIGTLPMLFRRRPWRSGLYVGLPSGVIVFAAMWWGVVMTRNEIEVTDVDIYSDKLPESFDGLRIVQFSDAHVGTWGDDTTFISTFVDSINALRPDVVVFTGDIVNRLSDELKPFADVLGSIRAKHGVYSILGNHDYGDYITWPDSISYIQNISRLRQMQSEMGWQLLDNRHVFLRNASDSIALIGVGNWGEPPFSQYADMASAYEFMPSGAANKSITDNNYKILLTHNPEHWRREVAEHTDIDLALSGHTHAMQFMLRLGKWKWSPAMFRYPMWGGLYPLEDNPYRQLYVNIGCGEVAMPFRIGAVPEITVLTLRRPDASGRREASDSSKR